VYTPIVLDNFYEHLQLQFLANNIGLVHSDHKNARFEFCAICSGHIV